MALSLERVSDSIIAAISARGGSKGIPQKNLKKLAGRPLIEWTVDTAKKPENLSKIIANTDNASIKKITESMGVEVIYFKRVDQLRHSRSFISEKTLGYFMPRKRSIDIDTFSDWSYAEYLIRFGPNEVTN
jgi:CMP-N-acetylneuraminic acid synthetase